MQNPNLNGPAFVDIGNSWSICGSYMIEIVLISVTVAYSTHNKLRSTFFAHVNENINEKKKLATQTTPSIVPIFKKSFHRFHRFSSKNL